MSAFYVVENGDGASNLSREERDPKHFDEAASAFAEFMRRVNEGEQEDVTLRFSS